MKILGLDLAGKENNPTGICMLHDSDIIYKTVYSNEDILSLINYYKPDIIAVDAPLIKDTIKIRKSDLKMKKYGALPPTLPGMTSLVRRAERIVSHLNNQYHVIEVFPTATAKILGV
ncbi:MAG: hypothetical protein QXS02_00640 [Candidatus Thermoplasmatota archaeon]